MMKRQKVFGIGFHKTGTSTLHLALKILGFKVCGNKTGLAQHLIDGELNLALDMLEDFDACEDTPWPLLYRQLDERYPGSKFILTTRDTNAWLKSILNHFGGHHSLMRQWIYGVGDPLGNEDVYVERYEKHNKDVEAYFKNRPEDLLIVNWKNTAGWQEICAFLDQPVPNKSFPHTNKGAYSNSSKAIQKFKLFVFRNFLKPLRYGR